MHPGPTSLAVTTTHDPEADAAYVRLAPEGTTIDSVREAGPGMVPDSEGRPVGLEVLNLRSRVAAGGAALAVLPAA